MRISRAIMICLLLFACLAVFAQEPLRRGPWAGKIPLEAESLWRSYVWEGGSWKESVPAKRVVERFSPEGLILSSELFLYSDGVFEFSLYTWRDGRLALVTVRDGTKRLLRTISYEYGEPARDGSIVRMAVTESAEGAPVQTEMEYFDPDGLLARAETLDDAGKPILERSYGYDGQGRCVWECAFAGGAFTDAALIWERSAAYGDEDEAGNWTTFQDREGFQEAWGRPRHSVRRSLKYAEAAQ